MSVLTTGSGVRIPPGVLKKSLELKVQEIFLTIMGIRTAGLNEEVS